MKKLLFFFMGILILSCSTENPEKSDARIEEASLSINNGETLKYEVLIMEALPTEGGPEITDQAEHYKVSELVWNESAIYYLYIPEEGFTGTETVEITNFLHNGAEVYDEHITKLTIEVTK